MKLLLIIMTFQKFKMCIAALMLLCSNLVVAHHAMEVHYLTDDESIIVKQGLVKNFSLLDPHSYLVVTVEEQSETTDWVLEGRSRVMLTRSGWRFDMLKPGATVHFTVYPARSGEPAGRILSIEVNGEIYCSDRCDLLGIETPELSDSALTKNTIVVSSLSD